VFDGIIGFSSYDKQTITDDRHEEMEMKTMTCKQLGGACDMEFSADTFEEIAKLSQQHGTEMFKKKDPNHLVAMAAMQKLMQSPDEMNQWFESKRKEFDAL
jgi:predicted small metal-binding protein